MVGLALNSDLKQLKGVGPKYRDIFQRQGFDSVMDLLLHFPLHYIDFSDVAETIEPGIKQLYHIEVTAWGVSRHYRRRLSVLRLKGRCCGETVSVAFFNQPYLADFFKTNNSAHIYARAETGPDGPKMEAPVLFPTAGDGGVEPVYAPVSTIKPGLLKQLIHRALDQLAHQQEHQQEHQLDHLPAALREKRGFPGTLTALEGIHRPREMDPDHIQKLKDRFIYTEFLFFQLELQFIRNHFRRVRRVRQYQLTPELEQAVAEQLPFRLTADQEKVLEEIHGDLRGDYTMGRLLQGDVGSGKTIVAFIALLAAIKNGFQGTMLAPTEILAAQHFANARSFFPHATLELLTGSTPAKKRKEILEGLANGSVHLVFGTHALLTESVQFQNLSMVVIDEQHRFGVAQRAALYYKGQAADLLVTTATPIPRTMLLTLYNDLSVSAIKCKPRDRKPIITKIIPPARRDEFYSWLKEKLKRAEPTNQTPAEKVFIVLPLIEKSDFFPDLRDIESESAYFKKVFKGIPLGIVTGKTPPAEKDALLADLARGTLRVLVATTVIEVGIDVTDATVIVIENADRYGLAQLHQLRGRVGRGALQSHCYLFPSPKITRKGKLRLQTIANTQDGFEIAETDLNMRGGGIIPGGRQSGHLDFRVGNMQDHYDIFRGARDDAARLLEDNLPENHPISDMLRQVQDKLKHITFS